MRQVTGKERREALEAQAKRESKQPYASELDDRDNEQAKKLEKPEPARRERRK